MGTLKNDPNSGNPHVGNPEPSQRNTREGVETRGVAPITCRICRADKPEDQFYKKDRTRYDTMCKRCRIIQQRERNLGVSQADYQRMLVSQDGRCGICLRRLYSKRYKAFCVDHCHKTNKVRGLLCHNCNGGLGMFQDDPERLLRAAAWVKG